MLSWRRTYHLLSLFENRFNFNGFVDSTNVSLTVTDYSRTTGLTSPGADGTDDRLIFNQYLTSAQLSDINFSGLAAQEFALSNGEYEVTPIPEPGTVFMAATIGFHLRRRLAA